MIYFALHVPPDDVSHGFYGMQIGPAEIAHGFVVEELFRHDGISQDMAERVFGNRIHQRRPDDRRIAQTDLHGKTVFRQFSVNAGRIIHAVHVIVVERSQLFAIGRIESSEIIPVEPQRLAMCIERSKRRPRLVERRFFSCDQIRMSIAQPDLCSAL